MTDNVVKLPPREERERAIWVCSCGCRSMNLLVDGTAECANCDQVVEADRGGWNKQIRDAGEYAGDVDPYQLVNYGNDATAADFARRHVGNRVHEKDTVAVVVVKVDGTISTWTPIETPKQHRWLKRRLFAAWQLMNPGGSRAR